MTITFYIIVNEVIILHRNDQLEGRSPMHYRPLTIRTQTDSTDAGKADDNEYMTSTLSEITKWLLLLCG